MADGMGRAFKETASAGGWHAMADRMGSADILHPLDAVGVIHAATGRVRLALARAAQTARDCRARERSRKQKGSWKAVRMRERWSQHFPRPVLRTSRSDTQISRHSDAHRSGFWTVERSKALRVPTRCGGGEQPGRRAKRPVWVMAVHWFFASFETSSADGSAPLLDRPGGRGTTLALRAPFRPPMSIRFCTTALISVTRLHVRDNRFALDAKLNVQPPMVRTATEMSGRQTEHGLHAARRALSGHDGTPVTPGGLLHRVDQRWGSARAMAESPCLRCGSRRPRREHLRLT